MKPIWLIVFFLLASINAWADEPLKILTFGSRSPYVSVSEDGKLSGLDIDFAKLLEEHLGRKIIIEHSPKEEVIDRILSGEADAVLGITQNRLGMKIFDYSKPYLHHRTRVFIRENNNLISRLADLRDAEVGVRAGVDLENFLKIIPGLRPVVQTNAKEGLENLIKGNIVVYMGDEYECDYVIQKERMENVTTLGGTVLLRRRSIAVAKGNIELLSEINKAMEAIERDGALQRLKAQWLTKRIQLKGTGRLSLLILLGALTVVAVILLISLIFNQKLSEAVQEKTENLRREHEHFENIFDHASDGIALIDPETMRPLQCNEAFCEMLGYEKNDLDMMSLKAIDASEKHDFKENINKASETEESVLFETRLLNQRNEPVDLFVHAKGFPFEGRTVVEAIARDITASKKIEMMKDTILQDVAHELKTPMAKLSMSLELLEGKMAKESDATAKHFDVCRRAMIRLQNTIEGILNLSRLESFTPKIDTVRFSLSDVMAQVVQELSIFAERKRIELKFQAAEGEDEVMGDEEMVRRLFINLVHNAIKFTDKGAVEVTITNDGEFVRVAVKDQGIGLEKDELTRIFDRFYQKSAAYEGSGVGLTISQKIVSFHNGVIWAESEGLGHGATMLVLFPRSQKERP